MMHVVVTGGSGKLGLAVVSDLLAHGHTVVNADAAPPQRNGGAWFVRIDVTDFGQVMLLLGGESRDFLPKPDAVVHLAAIPIPGNAPENVIFETNTLSTFNVFEAWRNLHITNVVWASSETLLGATRKALEATFVGAKTFIIANADTVMRRPSAELIANYFPGVPIRRPLNEHETILSIDKARRVLGYEPEYGWPR